MMKHIFGNVALLALGIFFGFTGAVLVRPEATPLLPLPPQTSSAEVSGLIARLAPLSKNPDGEWYNTGLTVTFSGTRSVQIQLKTPDGDEYHGKAATLAEAAKRITEPSTRIKEALQGWGPYQLRCTDGASPRPAVYECGRLDGRPCVCE